MQRPSAANGFLVEHITCLDQSLWRWAGRGLINEPCSSEQLARQVFLAPFVVVSHDASDDPMFTYGNRLALELWEMSWEEFTQTRSRMSAPAVQQAQRAQLLAEVRSKGFIEGYSGCRVSRSGKLFQIENATLWDLMDAAGNYYGQAAMFDSWHYL